MKRSPMPAIGSVFNQQFRTVLAEAFELNPSIHDGAIVFARARSSDDYLLTAWSMRIVSSAAPRDAEPNLGSAHNSALSLSVSSTIDLCCVISRKGLILFEDGLPCRNN